MSWEDYSNLRRKADDIFGTLARQSAYYHRQIARLGGQSREWYDAADGECCQPAAAKRAQLPAAILQPLLIHRRRQRLTMELGTVIGHDQPHLRFRRRRIDSKVRVRNWWTPEDPSLQRIDCEAGCAVRHLFHSDLHVNGADARGKIADVAESLLLMILSRFAHGKAGPERADLLATSNSLSPSARIGIQDTRGRTRQQY